MRFSGKIAVVTGGGKGLGLSIVQRLAQEGATVISVSASDSALTTAAEMQGDVTGVQCDVGDVAQMDKLCADIRVRHGRVDLLVNNAGISHSGQRLHEIPIDRWDRVMQVNVRGAFLVLRGIIPLMLERGGAIVNMGSIGAFRPVAKAGAYIVSKGTMTMLTRQAALEYATDNIRVNMVAPGPILTPLVEASGQATIDYLVSRVPLGHLGAPEDVAALTLFLLSDEAKFTTGAIYTAAGGMEAMANYAPTPRLEP